MIDLFFASNLLPSAITPSVNGNLTKTNQSLENKIGHVDVDVTSTVIDMQENGNYYSANISFVIPNNAIAINAIPVGNFTAGVYAVIKNNNASVLVCNKSCTLNQNRKVRVAYYIP